MPTYSQNFAQLRWGGAAWNGVEQWSCGLKLKHLGGDAISPMQDECEATIDECVTIVSSYVAAAESKHSWNVTLNWVSLNVVKKEDGKYAYPNNAVITEGLNVVGGTGAGIPQLALAITCRGSYVRGTAAYGRWFVPCSTTALETDGQIAPAYTQAAGNRAVVFLTALQSIDSGLGPDAWSPWLYGSGESGARDSQISTVSVGRVFDTQRRRRNTLIEDHTVAAGWPPA